MQFIAGIQRYHAPSVQKNFSKSVKKVGNCVDYRARKDDNIYIRSQATNQVKETTMAQFGIAGNDKIRCVCQRCEDIYYVADDLADEFCPIVSLADMLIDPDFDEVCVSCLTDEESEAVDKYITESKKIS